MTNAKVKGRYAPRPCDRFNLLHFTLQSSLSSEFASCNVSNWPTLRIYNPNDLFKFIFNLSDADDTDDI